MENKIKLTFNISSFEPISEDSENKLVGGFSSSKSGGKDSVANLSNNCHGGNCVWGCGSGQNVGCNEVAGCGAPADN